MISLSCCDATSIVLQCYLFRVTITMCCKALTLVWVSDLLRQQCIVLSWHLAFVSCCDDTCVMCRCRQGSVGTRVTARFRDPVDVSELSRVVSQSLLSASFTYTVNNTTISVTTQGRQARRGYLNPQYFGAVCCIKAPIRLVKITTRNIVPKCVLLRTRVTFLENICLSGN